MTTSTPAYAIEAIPTTHLDALRRAGSDGTGQPWTPFTVDDPAAVPLRCCLRMAHPGERAALVAYRPPGGTGAYAETGPVFVHADVCGGYSGPDAWPPAFADRRQVLRAYDRAGRIAGAVLAEPGDGPRLLAGLLAGSDVALVQSRNVLHGCYMFAARRV